MFNLSKNLILCFLSSSLVASATSLFQTGQSTVAAGSVFNVYVGVQNAYVPNGIAGYQFDLNWNPSVITLVSETEGSFLSFNYGLYMGFAPNNTFFYKGAGLSSSGYLSGVSDVTDGSMSPAMGGTLVDFTFKAGNNAASTEIDLSNQSFIDPDGTLLPSNILNRAFNFNIGPVASAPVSAPGISLPIGTGTAPTPEPSTASFLALTAAFATASWALRKKRCRL